ncbi:MAG: sugar-binding domain-containing protein [Actinomycetaceae bacterium]|nr:sugar-binding domain-containing protein [Actinomycetaceae bacterium]
MNDRDSMAHTAASMYHLQGKTMETIAQHLKVSRPTVSRLLTYAQNTGIVTITVNQPAAFSSILQRKLKEVFGVSAWVVEVPPGTTRIRRLQEVAKVAAAHLTSVVQAGDTIAVAWGNTTAEVAAQMKPAHVPGVTVVQINGAGAATTTGVPHAGAIVSQIAQAFEGHSIHFPVPAFFDHEETRQALVKERSIQRVLTAQQQARIALFGVGSFSSEIPSHVYSGGYLSNREIAMLEEEGAVGDICTVIIRADGTYQDITINRRASGPSPANLRRIPVRICVVSGKSKSVALLGALKAQVPTDLIISSDAAKEVLRIEADHAWSQVH